MNRVREKLNLLPERPGVYLMKDESSSIIYVGKAKVLKNRVRSYFTGSHDAKTQQMISNIADFEYIITESEVEALVLECNLIKRHRPKYNILLRDDKTYPFLMITNERHPRLLVTRTLKKGAGKYFGPYPSASAAREAARLLNRLFPFRKCRTIPQKPCLYYHLGQCLGPCTTTVTDQDYDDMTRQVTSFLKGGQDKIIKSLRAEMAKSAESLDFERAKELRDLIRDLEQLHEKQNMTINDFVDRDVLGYAFTTDLMSIQIFHFRQGKLLSHDSFIFPYYEEIEDAFSSFIVQFYTEQLIPEEILIPPLADATPLNSLFPISIPKKGKRLDLVKLAISNAENILHEQIMLEARQIEENQQALCSLGEALGIPSPELIDAFDISNTAGTNPVGGLIQFKHGKPFRSGYRKFKVREMPQMDDTACMHQVVTRRYRNLLERNEPLPSLILVDGGKGQVNAALQALNDLQLNIPVAGMVKNDRHQTEGLVNSSGVLSPIAKHSPVFHLLERIQEEVHRFAITFHRQQRAKSMVLSELDAIPGVGPKRRQLLLRYFKSIDNIRSASVDELQGAGLPQNIATEVYNHFHH